MKLFAMSDIHSFYEPMVTALEKNGFEINNKDHHLVVCGDLFDRGPDAIKVFEFVKRLANEGRFHYVCGNHEELLFECLNEVHGHIGMSSHHVSNGTFDTIMQLTGVGKYDLLHGFYDKTEFAAKMGEVIDFIADNAIDYVEFGDYVFVHGWIPCNQYTGKVEDNWRDGDWESARWINGMAAWYKGARVPNKTIVCGHFHTSWGHSHIHQDRKEFPQKNRSDWQKSFEIFEDEGIIALDACTVYTGFCNCLVIEI